MTKPLVSPEITKARIARWIDQATPIDKNPQWTERRLAIKFGEHTYLLTDSQIFQCAHCGYYDPKWSVSEVISFFRETFGIKPVEIEVVCSVAVVS